MVAGPARPLVDEAFSRTRYDSRVGPVGSADIISLTRWDEDRLVAGQFPVASAEEKSRGPLAVAIVHCDRTLAG